MSFAKTHNASIEPRFTFQTPEHFEYVDLKKLYEANPDATHKLNAIYINDQGLYGDQPVLVTDNELVNAPAHIMKSVIGILESEKAIREINAGRAGFKVYTYENKYGTNYSLSWADL